MPDMKAEVIQRPGRDGTVRIWPDEAKPTDYFQITVQQNGMTNVTIKSLDVGARLEVVRTGYRDITIAISSAPQRRPLPERDFQRRRPGDW